MIYLVIFFVLGLVFIYPSLRCLICHPIKAAYYAAIDLWRYIRQKSWNMCPTGKLDIYTGYFGSGKTLSLVHRVVGLYNQYNGKPVWCPRRQKFVTQRILILSNVDLCVPYTLLENLKQIVEVTRINDQYDDEHNTLTVTIACLDELSVQLNSRDFRNNINAYFLNTLMCCRHYHLSFFASAQRFPHVDKMLRDVTQNVIDCKKVWRCQVNRYFDGFMLENAQDPNLIKPLSTQCWFVENKHFAAYDTLQIVDNLTKKFDEDDIMSDAEILALQDPAAPVPLDHITRPSRFTRKARKK